MLQPRGRPRRHPASADDGVRSVSELATCHYCFDVCVPYACPSHPLFDWWTRMHRAHDDDVGGSVGGDDSSDAFKQSSDDDDDDDDSTTKTT